MNTPKLQLHSTFIAQSSFHLLMALFFSATVRAQNSYPTSGDALIHGLTIGTGAGNGSNFNTALGASALSLNQNGFSNVAVGNGAMGWNTNGYWNTALGTSALTRNITGNGNTATGFASLNWNSTGYQNTATGFECMQFNTTGISNTANGLQAMYRNTTGNTNTAVGIFALLSNSTGNSNVAIGASALISNYSQSNLVAIGDSSLLSNTTGYYNVAVGSKSLYSNTTGFMNTAVGFQNLYSNTSGSSNNSFGYQALFNNQGGGFNNCAFGSVVLFKNSSGNDNTAIGNASLYFNTSGGYNTAVGNSSLYSNTIGSYNSALGVNALQTNTTGYFNTAVGEFADVASNNLSYCTSIGVYAVATASNSVRVGGSTVTSIGGYANWTNFSDGRYKKNINQNVPGLSFINKLKPITYTLDIQGIEQKLHGNQNFNKGQNLIQSPTLDPAFQTAVQEKSKIVYTGFVAQDVDKAAQSLGYDFSGVGRPKDDKQSFYGLRYSDFVVPLVKAVQELSAANDSLVSANALLSSRLEQIEQILGITKNKQASSIALSSARLYQNAPNPSNQNTIINYYLPQTAGSAMITVTGINGETIKSISLNGNGNGQLSIQTAQLASGSYSYTLIVDGNIVDTKKMIIVR